MFYHSSQGFNQLIDDILSAPSWYVSFNSNGQAPTGDTNTSKSSPVETKSDKSEEIDKITEFVHGVVLTKDATPTSPAEYEVELPGFSKDDVTIEIKQEVSDDNTLNYYYIRVEATRRETSVSTSKVIRHRWTEFHIPEDSNLDTVTSEIKNGLLTIKVHKLPAAQPFKKTVKVA